MEKLILKLIASPFVLAVLLVFHIYTSFKNTFLFIKHGGEWITYRDDDKPTIYKIYKQLKNKE